MTNTYRDILLCFLDQQYVMTTALVDIDPNNKAKTLKNSKIYLGIKVNSEITNEPITKNPELIKHFYEKCLDFLLVVWN